MRRTALVLLICMFVTTTNAQRIVSDTLLQTYSLTQLNDLYNSLGIPSSVLELKYGIKIYKVIYNTLTYDSIPTTASGLMIFPDTQVYCKMPILSYQHGTIVRKIDAPSRMVGDERYITYAMASKGIACTMPDYHGLGDGPGYHPYQNARTEAFAVIDIIRAIKEKAPQMGITLGEKLFLTGYSQGGHATMAAHKMIQEKLSGEMSVTASAPMSGAYDMSGVMVDLMLKEAPYASPYYLPYLIFGNNPIYHFFNSPTEILVAPYDTLIPPLMDGIAGFPQINANMSDTVKRILRLDVIDSFTNNPNYFFRNFLKDNDIYQWTPQSPMRIFFCNGDEQVPYQNSIVAYNYFISHGAMYVDTVNSGNSLHMDCAVPSFLGGKGWLESFLDAPINTTRTVTPQINTTLGSIKINITGGKLPYSILWTNGANSDSLTGLNAGTYSFTITDANGCTISDSAVVEFSNGIENLLAKNISVYPVPSSSLVFIKNEATQPISVVTVRDILGNNMNIEYEKNDSTIDIAELASGVYIVEISIKDIIFQKKIIKR